MIMFQQSHCLVVTTALASLLCSTGFTFKGANNLSVIRESKTSRAFDVIESPSFAKTGHIIRLETVLLAKKKRRRRKDGSTPQKKDEMDRSSSGNDGELPDFDLDEDDDLVAPFSEPAVDAMPSTAIDINDEAAIIEAMKAKGGGSSSTSTSDLLRSRNVELEKRFVVDDVTMDVPNLAEYARRDGLLGGGAGEGESKMGKKAARAAARRKAAIEAESAMEGESPVLAFLDNVPRLPFMSDIKDEKGKINLFKIIENGAWAGIYTLVIWEIYINSPFFERAAPMIPAVFNDPTTMT